jgi:hypothetical protein
MKDIVWRDMVPAKSLKAGDLITRPERRFVQTVVVNPRGCLHHTHVNGDHCYDNDAMVEIAMVDYE